VYPLIELPVWPSVAWMTLLWKQGALVLETQEHFQKGSFRNRYHLAGPNGLQRLSIPLAKGKHQQSPIREVRLSYDEPWQRTHWRSIVTAYGNAPYFEYFEEGLSAFYFKKYDYLYDFNLEILQWTLKTLSFKGTLQFSETFQTKSVQTPMDYRDQLTPGAEKYPDWFAPHRYAQVFSERFGFIPNLSVLDLLMCQGKQSCEILEKSWRSV
jgi:hypothetical protein